MNQVSFYTGVPDVGDNPSWHYFWSNKLAAMGRQSVVTYSRPLRHRNRTVVLSDGTQRSSLSGEAKGIDVIALGHRREYDVALS